MGCGGSKVEEFPVVTLCRERKQFLKAATEQRYALAAAHVAYFQSLRDIGEALRRFADQDLLTAPSSPVLTLPSHEGKSKKTNTTNNHLSSSSPSISHPDSPSPQGSHLHLSSGSDFSSPSSGHIHINQTPEPEPEEPPFSSSPPYGFQYPYPQDWTHPGANTYAYYMKKSAPHGKSMIYEEPERHVATSGQWPDPPYGYGYPGVNVNGGFFGFPAGPSSSSSPPPPPAPPSPPRVSTWDFLNFFDAVDNGYPGYGYSVFGSSASSPDSKEVREREGIPELEDETEQETLKEARHEEKKKKMPEEEKLPQKERDFGEGTSNTKAVPLQQLSSSDGSSKTVRFHSSDGGGSLSAHEKESPDTVASKSSPEEQGRKKGVSFEMDRDEAATVTTVDGDSSMLSSITTLSPHGTRDLREVVQEIRNEFETLSNCGKEVALLLEVCKPPYRSKVAALRGMNDCD